MNELSNQKSNSNQNANIFTNANTNSNTFHINEVPIPSMDNQILEYIPDLDQKRKRTKSNVQSKFKITNVKLPQSCSNRKLSIEVSISSSSASIFQHSDLLSNNNDSQTTKSDSNPTNPGDNQAIHLQELSSMQHNSKNSRFKISVQPNGHRRSSSNPPELDISNEKTNLSFLSQNAENNKKLDQLIDIPEKDKSSKNSDSDLIFFSEENSNTERQSEDSSDDLLSF